MVEEAEEVDAAGQQEEEGNARPSAYAESQDDDEWHTGDERDQDKDMDDVFQQAVEPAAGAPVAAGGELLAANQRDTYDDDLSSELSVHEEMDEDIDVGAEDAAETNASPSRTTPLAESYPDLAEMVIQDLNAESFMARSCKSLNKSKVLHQDPAELSAGSRYFVGFRCKGEGVHEFIRAMKDVSARVKNDREACSFCEYKKPSGYYGANRKPNSSTTEPISPIFVSTTEVGLLASS
jgi:hypothetical protein